MAGYGSGFGNDFAKSLNDFLLRRRGFWRLCCGLLGWLCDGRFLNWLFSCGLCGCGLCGGFLDYRLCGGRLLSRFFCCCGLLGWLCCGRCGFFLRFRACDFRSFSLLSGLRCCFLNDLLGV